MGLLTIVALLTTQAFWLVRALTLQEKEFSQSVHMALKETAQEIRAFNGTEGPLIDPVDQLSDNYYIVMVNDVIDANALEIFLTRNMQARNVQEDFEYGVYDCNNEQLAYGNYVALATDAVAAEPTELPRLDKDNYYFGVLFPQKQASLTGQTALIVGGAVLTLLVVGFFGYTLVIMTRQRRLSEVQRDFINNMTHEFKTPLSTMAISSAVLKDPDMKGGMARVHNYAGIISEEANRLLSQVDRVLQVARTDRGTERLRLEPIILADTVQEVLDQHAPVLEENGGRLEADLTESCIILADSLHVKNMLFNLLDNAMKYSDDSPKITITTGCEGKRGWVRVSDEGLGLSSKDQKRIFDRFYRVPTGNLHDVKGFGLGLTYVKRMMQRHHGDVKLESELGQGSSFTLIFPKQR
ncbi:MAG TPA: two-component sensor histidine kinase [Cytophagales bacterium]|nr:two-component sensor histidine kinase [Cytophagales bacterium]